MLSPISKFVYIKFLDIVSTIDLSDSFFINSIDFHYYYIKEDLKFEMGL